MNINVNEHTAETCQTHIRVSIEVVQNGEVLPGDNDGLVVAREQVPEVLMGFFNYVERREGLAGGIVHIRF